MEIKELMDRNDKLEADLYSKAIRIRDLENELKDKTKENESLKSFIISSNLSKDYKLYLRGKGGNNGSR